MHINLNQLRCLYMAARYKSMAEAAARLFVSPPAITMQIKKLEQALGMKLVYRQHNELRLTEQGQRVYSHAVSIFEQVERLEHALAAMKARGKEMLVGVYHIPGQYLMPALLDHWRRLCPELRVRMVLGTQAESLQRLRRHEIHCAVMVNVEAVDNFQAVPFFTDRLLLVAGQGTERLSGKEITVAQLDHLPLLLPQEGTGILRSIEDFLQQHQVQPQIAMAGISGDVIKELVARDLGLAFLVGYSVRREVADGVLREITIREGGPEVQFSLVTHAQRNDRQLAQALDALASLDPKCFGALS
ncbi:MAG: LysR family transcriptional regulator [bacterium]|nr:LysR family transcriptional regulator [bacterium]